MVNSQFPKLFVVLFLLTSPSLTFAAGLQISPAKLDFKLNAQSTTEQALVVVNPTNDVQVFEVYPDDFIEAIQAAPASFTLEAGARKNVKISIDGSKLKKDQRLVTSISIVGKPLADNKFSVGTGAKIPVTVSVPAPANPAIPSWLLWRLIFGAMFLILVFISSKPHRWPPQTGQTAKLPPASGH